MNTPGDPFPQLKRLAARSKDARFTILVTGSTTVYTSSMTNPLSGTRIIQVHMGEKGTLEIITWERSINDLPCRIIMIPELAHISHDPVLSKNLVEAIKNAISPIHCIWFAVRLNETTLHKDEQNVINWITTILGEQAWNYAILVLTHANTIKDAWKRADMMKKRSENIRAEISLYTGWDIAANITSVPVIALDDIMLNGKKWLPELYEQIMRRSNLKGITASAGAAPPIQKDHSVSGDKLPQETKKILEDTLVRTLTWCYLSSALVGIVGMSIYGPRGFIIGLAGNLAFWMLLRFVHTLQTRH